MKFDYELIDSGNRRRLERFGKYIFDRPAPQAKWEKSLGSVWQKANAFYIREGKKREWVGKSLDSWDISLGDLTLELRQSPNNQVGIFPEQYENWKWIDEKIREAGRPVKVLNTFAYTGVASLVAANAGAEVCHVDGAKSSVNWCKESAKKSGLEGKVRFIVDDVIKFMTREVKRGKKYDAIILDPPAFGRGDKKSFTFEKDLLQLLDLVNELLSDNPLFVILSGHNQFVSSEDFLGLLKEVPKLRNAKGEAIDLLIPSKTGNDLPSSYCGRVEF